jgi:putative membrane protein
MMVWNGQWAFWQILLMWIGMIAFWGALIWLAYYFITSAMRSSRQQEPRPTAKQILDERLARGEIDSTEYDRLRGVISADEPTQVHARSAL